MAVASCVGVTDGVNVTVGVTETAGVSVGVTVTVGVTTGVSEIVGVIVAVIVIVGVTVGVTVVVGVTSGVPDGVTDVVGVMVGDGGGAVKLGVTVGVTGWSVKHPPPPCTFVSSASTDCGIATFCVICKATHDVLKNSLNSSLFTNASLST